MTKALPALLLLAAAARAEDVAGHYVLEGVREVGSELLLKPGGTFEYMLAYGAADYFAKGTWRRQDDAVILKSDGKEQAPFRMVSSGFRQGAGIRVWVKGLNGRGVEHIEVALRSADGDAEEKTTADGAALFPATKQPRAVMFRVPVYSVEAGPFELNPAHNDFYFEINGDAITQVRFQDERLAIEGSSLILRFWNKDQPMRYLRQ
jgi:hypothetical protein